MASNYQRLIAGDDGQEMVVMAAELIRDFISWRKERNKDVFSRKYKSKISYVKNSINIDRLKKERDEYNSSQRAAQSGDVERDIARLLFYMRGLPKIFGIRDDYFETELLNTDKITPSLVKQAKKVAGAIATKLRNATIALKADEDDIVNTGELFNLLIRFYGKLDYTNIDPSEEIGRFSSLLTDIAANCDSVYKTLFVNNDTAIFDEGDNNITVGDLKSFSGRSNLNSKDTRLGRIKEMYLDFMEDDHGDVVSKLYPEYIGRREYLNTVFSLIHKYEDVFDEVVKLTDTYIPLGNTDERKRIGTEIYNKLVVMTITLNCIDPEVEWFEVFADDYKTLDTNIALIKTIANITNQDNESIIDTAEERMPDPVVLWFKNMGFDEYYHNNDIDAYEPPSTDDEQTPIAEETLIDIPKLRKLQFALSKGEEITEDMIVTKKQYFGILQDKTFTQFQNATCIAERHILDLVHSDFGISDPKDIYNDPAITVQRIKDIKPVAAVVGMLMAAWYEMNGKTLVLDSEPNDSLVNILNKYIETQGWRLPVDKYELLLIFPSDTPGNIDLEGHSLALIEGQEIDTSIQDMALFVSGQSNVDFPSDMQQILESYWAKVNISPN
jgi:hypothetical protein